MKYLCPLNLDFMSVHFQKMVNIIMNLKGHFNFMESQSFMDFYAVDFILSLFYSINIY